jgi:ABC-2 type transport system permease protein
VTLTATSARSRVVPPPRSETAPRLRTVFFAVARSEWTKLRTVRSTMWALLFAGVSTVGIGTLLTALELNRWSQRTPVEVRAFDPLLYSLAGINLAQLAVGVLGVLVMTSEYTAGAMMLTLGATPQRGLLLGAKLATFSAVIAIVGVISCFTVFFLSEAILGSQHGGVSIADPGVFRAVLGGAAHLVLIGAIAVGVGAIVRRTAGAIAVLFAVLLVVPGLVALLPSPWNDNITKVLPSSAGVAMSAVQSFPNLLSPLNGLLLLCGYTAAVTLAATLMLARRDA